MLLAAAVGVLLDLVFGLHNAVVFALLAGLVLAQFVPSKASCQMPSRDPPIGPDGTT